MSHRVPGCLGQYDFDQVINFAKKRFIEGLDTITLLSQARSIREKEEIILISLLDVDDADIRDIQLSCPHACDCQILDCRQRLKRMFKERLNQGR